MVQLVKSDIRTTEVLAWKGLHVFHARGSSCSQKLRIFLNLKGMPWESHLIDLQRKENLTEYYLGVNPRGLVPAIVHDGDVHIESNDIILYLEEQFPQPSLIPVGHRADLTALLAHEDELHLDLRTLTFGFMLRGVMPKSQEDLEHQSTRGSGTVRGVQDPNRRREISFWQDMAAHGITDAAAKVSAQRFRAALDDLERRLEQGPFLLGPALSILDVAWFVYVERLRKCGYPIARLHPRVQAWIAGLSARPEFAQEVAMPAAMAAELAERQRELEQAGETLAQVAGLS